MTTIYVDSRKRVAGSDSDFEVDLGESLHLQSDARLAVYKIRIADSFLSTDRGRYLYCMDAALGTLNWALLPEGAYTGSRLAAWISSNFATATYSETTNSLSVAYDGNRLILNDLELQQQFPNVVDYPTSPAASPSSPFSIDHMLGPSFVSGGQQVFEFVRMMAYNEVYLRCPQLANASRVLGNLVGDDILSKITLKSGVGTIVETGSDDGRFMAVRGPITLRHLRFRLTDLEGQVVRLRGQALLRDGDKCLQVLSLPISCRIRWRLYLSCERIGEADNPGPDQLPTVCICAFNPTSVYQRSEQLAQCGDVVLLSETSATQRVQKLDQYGLRLLIHTKQATRMQPRYVVRAEELHASVVSLFGKRGILSPLPEIRPVEFLNATSRLDACRSG